MSALGSIVFAGGLVAASGGMVWLRSLGAGSGPRLVSLADIVAAAPSELRTTVSIFADPSQMNLMLHALGLGSAEVGFPKLDDWVYTAHGLQIDLLMLGGQKLKDWTDEGVRDQFAHYLAAPEVTVSSPAKGWVRLQVRVFDTLAAPAALPVAVADDVDLEAVLAGVFEDGDAWRVPVQGRHVLIAGGTGSGKSGVLWSLVNGMGPAIASGRVELRVIDPKGGQELWFLEGLCTHFSCTTGEEMVTQLEETVTDMEQATQRYRGVRKPVPTPENPLVVTIIDEAATLSAFSDPKLQARFERAHGKLLSQGRAPLFSVIETVIDPSKENVPQRQLLPYRIGMRMDEAAQVVMIHGQGARERGSHCDEIPHTTPGVCYVQEDGKAGFRRARAFLVTDDDVDRIVVTYKPVSPPVDRTPQPADAPIPAHAAAAVANDPYPLEGVDARELLGDDDIPGDGETGPVAA
ncbi:FtsK/SpoIIIE domain-containing protein [Nocardia noduli]|uniref:FtsK/SpoIIIE domain-containing protein n=1 Tax=Nocardia noduli TaxID=2815722 RepID=UPI001C2336D4|nr:FtsK/SpoIIIE domain-containing protein [Nocardia noduli]